MAGSNPASRVTAIAQETDEDLHEQAASPEPTNTWPDGTPKLFQGAEAWKNWIDWNSRHTDQTDELNRLRHFFYHVDSRGRLLRRDLGEPAPRWPTGHIRDKRFLEYFFTHIQPNPTGLYADEYPFLSRRAHEAYFVSCSDAPLVFNHLHVSDVACSSGGVRAAELRMLCPDGGHAASLSTTLQPGLLRICDAGRLFHPVHTVATYEPDEVIPPLPLNGRVAPSAGSKEGYERRGKERVALQMLALVDTSVAASVLELVDCQLSGGVDDDEAGENNNIQAPLPTEEQSLFSIVSLDHQGARLPLRRVELPWEVVEVVTNDATIDVEEVEVEMGD